MTEDNESANRAGTAETLEELAAQPQLTHRASQLRDLAETVRTGDHHSNWHGVSLRQEFTDAVVTTKMDELSPGMRIASASRLILVFLPVAISWFGIHQAASAYQGYKPPNGTEESFFEAWLNGFHGELSFGFGAMAISVLVSIVALVVWWMAVDWRLSKHQEAVDAEIAELTARLEATLTSASLQLSGRSATTPEDMVSALAMAAKDMRDLVAKTKEAAYDIQKATDKLADAGVSVADAAGAVENSADAAADAIKQVGAASDEAMTRLSSASEGITGVIGEHQAAIENQLRRSHTELSDLVREISAGLTDLVREISGELNNIRASAEQNREAFGRQLQDHRTDMDGLVARLAEHTERTVGAVLTENRDQVVSVLKPLQDEQAKALAPMLLPLRDQLIALSYSVDGLRKSIMNSNFEAPPPPRSRRFFGRRR